MGVRADVAADEKGSEGERMATASMDRGILWTDMEGREVGGRWRLTRLVRPEGRAAWFEATGQDGRPAMVILTETLNDEEELLGRLRAATEIRHPNVVSVLDAQQIWVGDTPIVMAATEPTDENLADVLRERTLYPMEGVTLVDGLLQGLAAIHAKRLVHGRMEPGSVLAMGETIKLRSDCLHPEGFATAAAEDVQGLGRVVTQALTGRVPAGENDPVLQLLSDPLARAVRRALSGNATVEEIAALAGTRITQPVEQSSRKPAAEARSEKAAGIREALGLQAETERKAPEKKVLSISPEEAEIGAKAGRAQMELPLLSRSKELGERAIDRSEDGAPGRNRIGGWQLPQWAYHRRGAPYLIAAAAVLIVGTLFMLHGWLHRGGVEKAVKSSRVVVEHGAVPPKANAAKELRRTLAKAKTAPAASGAAGNWRVVVFTYQLRKDAEQRARILSQRYAQLQPGVTPLGKDFVVTLGQPMSREAAAALRNRAVKMGLPRDTYALKMWK